LPVGCAIDFAQLIHTEQQRKLLEASGLSIIGAGPNLGAAMTAA
jgi:hypothetical protein